MRHCAKILSWKFRSRFRTQSPGQLNSTKPKKSECQLLNEITEIFSTPGGGIRVRAAPAVTGRLPGWTRSPICRSSLARDLLDLADSNENDQSRRTLTEL